MDPNITKHLIETRNILKKKFNSIKQGEVEKELMLEKTFKPLTTPLNAIVEKTSNIQFPNEEHDLFDDLHTSTPLFKRKKSVKTFGSSAKRKKLCKSRKSVSKLKDSSLYESLDNSYDNEQWKGSESENEEQDEDQIKQERQEFEQSMGEESNDEPPLPESHKSQEPSFQDDLSSNKSASQSSDQLQLYLNDESRLDRVYGPRKDENDMWFLGKTQIFFRGKSIEVNNTKYPLTQGLYELLFFKDPLQHTQNDLAVYKKILEKTSVHRRKQTPSGKIKASNSKKYKNIIKELFPIASSSSVTENLQTPRKINLRKSSKTMQYKGGGLMKLNLNKPNYVYWDDPNELVERLRLLMSSSLAGHSNHNNEIMSIIEELKEANIIY